jgi:hypothetical protein
MLPPIWQAAAQRANVFAQKVSPLLLENTEEHEIVSKIKLSLAESLTDPTRATKQHQSNPTFLHIDTLLRPHPRLGSDHGVSFGSGPAIKQRRTDIGRLNFSHLPPAAKLLSSGQRPKAA